MKRVAAIFGACFGCALIALTLAPGPIITGGGVKLQSSTPGNAQTGNLNVTGTALAGTLKAATVTDTGLAANGVCTNTAAGTLGTLAGTTTTLLHGNAAGLPTYSAVALGSDVSGTLPEARGGTNAGALTCTSDQATTSDGTSYSCKSIVNLQAAWPGTIQTGNVNLTGIIAGGGTVASYVSGTGAAVLEADSSGGTTQVSIVATNSSGLARALYNRTNNAELGGEEYRQSNTTEWMVGMVGSSYTGGAADNGWRIIDRVNGVAALAVAQGATPVVTLKTTTFATGVTADGAGMKHKRGTAGCATAALLDATCTTVITWSTAFGDANYTAQCGGRVITSGVPANGGLTAQSASSVTFQTIATSAAAAQYTNIDCVAIHD